jgi:hypothetical protein
MQTQSEIDALIARAASTALGKHTVAHISSKPGVDSDGLDAVRVMIVLSGRDDTLTGDAALSAIVNIRQALQEAGDERFPYVEFTNEYELASDADPEPDPSV